MSIILNRLDIRPILKTLFYKEVMFEMEEEIYNPKVGIMTLIDPREEFYKAAMKIGFDYDGLNKKNHNQIIKKLREKNINILEAEIVDSKEGSVKATKRFIYKGIELLVIFIPGWTFPSFSAVASRIAAFSSIPTLLIASFGLSGPTAAKGALDEIGATYKVIYGSLDNKEIVNKMVSYAKAVSVVTKLRGMTYGLIGGRSMGMYTAVVDPSYWLKVFGIDIEHVDQSEILRLTRKISEKRVDKLFKWLKDSCAKVNFDEEMLTPEILRKQILGYLAIKEISENNKFDFISVKCINELSDHFCSQCIAAGLMNDPYDDEDLLKSTTVMACEADSNGALSMEILKLLSGGKPVLFMDLIFSDEKENVITCMNCGGASTWYAARSKESVDNLSRVEILPHVHGKAGGGCFAYTAKSSSAVTWMRLSRVNGKYKMFIIKGKLVDNIKPEICLPWPTAHVKLNFNPQVLLEEYDSQHAHIVEGDFVKECKYVAELLGMDAKVFM
jgi:L-fucose isomerase